jgi:hypothetical protein
VKRILWIGLFCAGLVCGSCTAPVGAQDSAKSKQQTRISDAQFPVAAPPLFEADSRPQREQDLETIGRPR